MKKQIVVEKTTTVKSMEGEKFYFVSMSKEVNRLRKELWKTIFSRRGKINYCDISMSLGLVQYELLHHSEEIKKKLK